MVYDNLSRQSAELALDAWMDSPHRQAGDTVWAYSLGTQGVLDYLRHHQDEPQKPIKYILMGSPELGGSSLRKPLPVSPVPAEQIDYDNVTFVVVQYDLVADAPARFSWLALLNLSAPIHVSAYHDLNMKHPDAVYVDPITGARTLYFTTKVLPLLERWDWLLRRADGLLGRGDPTEDRGGI